MSGSRCDGTTPATRRLVGSVVSSLAKQNSRHESFQAWSRPSHMRRTRRLKQAIKEFDIRAEDTAAGGR
jgi:hypothetical protein